jgi:hypothetical protein
MKTRILIKNKPCQENFQNKYKKFSNSTVQERCKTIKLEGSKLAPSTSLEFFDSVNNVPQERRDN